MECLLQYLDDIDDLVGAIGLFYERLRRLAIGLTILSVSLALVASAIWLAQTYPTLALATCLLLLVTLLYFSAVSPPRSRARVP